jgi:hypothetical protein
MEEINNNLTSWDVRLDEKYGKPGTPTREKYEQESEAFKIGMENEMIKFHVPLGTKDR